ncbi:DeoR family transcriptional regulator [Halobacteriales archaeon QS_3_64_16]|nr:MAG: DeoR family transcriptional regulator [Halobacteriales archaeon QS_3_64_16]
MLPDSRRREIVEQVREHDGRSVTELADRLGFSKATIRRDLRDLDAEGLIERSHGGAVPTKTIGRERSYDQREIRNLEAKTAIGERAAGEIDAGEIVFFDAGTTTMEAAKAISEEQNFLAVTNSPLCALGLAEDDREVKLTGGTLRPRTRALVGPSAEEFMERIHVDLLFLGTNAIDAERGLMTPNEDEARVKQLMVEHAERVVLLADASKLGERSFVGFADLADIDFVCTDADLDGEEGTHTQYREAFAESGVEVVSVGGKT